MEIGQYIGKFLVKNNYCSLSGLGVFELKKNAASVRSSENTVAPPTHVISFTPVGSIDDSFASFIANRENVSISNASNNIKDYCISAKQELQTTGHFTIEHLGKLVMTNNKISFVQSSDLDLGYEPVSMPAAEQKISSTSKSESGDKLDFSYPPSGYSTPTKSSSVMKYVMLGGLALLLLGGVYMAYDYYQKNKIDTEDLLNPTVSVPNTDTTNANSNGNVAISDTTAQSSSSDTTTMTVTSPAPVSPGAHLVAVFTFNNEAAAAAKAKKLNNYGNKATVNRKDSTNFVVTLEATHALGDTTLLVDSLRKFFNPKGNVYIWK